MQRNRVLTTFVLPALLALGLGVATIPAANAAYDDYFTGALRGFQQSNPPAVLPATTFYDANNSPATLNAFQGRVVLVMLWATWCPYCRLDMPKMKALQSELGQAGLVVLPISYDKEGASIVRKYYQANNYSFPIYTDPYIRIGDVIGTRGIPHFLLIGRDGRLIGQISGATDWTSDEAKGFLRSVLNPAGRG